MRNIHQTRQHAQGPILVVHPSPDLYGSDRMLVEAVRGLVKAHGDVVVVLPHGGRLVPSLVDAGARVCEVPTLVLGKRLLAPSRWPLLVRDVVRGTVAAERVLRRLQPEAVYINTLTLPLWPVLSRCNGVRTVVHIHEAEQEAPAWVRAALALPLIPAHMLVVNSEFSRSVTVASVPGLSKKTHVVLNGVSGPPGGPRPARDEIRDGLRILYVGRLSERKGVHLLIDVLRVLRSRGVPAVIDVVGDVYPGYDWFEKLLRRSAESAGVGGLFRLRGFDADVWPWFHAADVVVVPSVRGEPFGNTAVEAVLAARPVIVADHSGLREAVAGFGSAQRVDTRAEDTAVKLADALVRVRDNWDHYRSAAVADEALARCRHRPGIFSQRVADAVLDVRPGHLPRRGLDRHGFAPAQGEPDDR